MRPNESQRVPTSLSEFLNESQCNESQRVSMSLNESHCVLRLQSPKMEAQWVPVRMSPNESQYVSQRVSTSLQESLRVSVSFSTSLFRLK